MKIAKTTIDAAVICDDVRREINNKFILIGVWPLEFALANYPSEIGFMLHCQGAVLESGNINPRLKILDEIGGILYDSDLSDKIERGQFIRGRYGIEFNASLTVTRDCILNFYVRIGDEEIIACTRRVVLLETLKKERDVEINLLSLDI